MAKAMYAGSRYVENSRRDTMSRVARRALDPRIVKKPMTFCVEDGSEVELTNNDIVYVNMVDRVDAFQKAGRFFIISES